MTLILNRLILTLNHIRRLSYKIIFLIEMLKNNKSQKIIRFSKDISSLPDYQSNKNILPIL